MSMTRALRSTALALVVLAASAGAARATEVGRSRRIGLGVQIFDPTAIIGKVFIGGGNAIDFGLGFGGVFTRCRRSDGSYARCNDVGGRFWSLHGDYLWQDNLVREGNFILDWHIGAGARLIFDSGNDTSYVQLNARMPLGLDATFNRPNFLEVFLEIAPSLVIVPPLWFDIDVALGVRLYF
jgi:hypothetical protein